MTKRILCTVLALVLALALAIPCFADDTDPLGKYEDTVTLTTARANNVTVTFDETNPEKISFEQNRLVDTYKDRLNIDVQYKWIAADGTANTSKWAAAIASGDLPDFAMVDDSIYALLLESEVIADCKDVYDTYAIDGYKGMLNDDAIGQIMYDGQMMGLPWPSHSYYGPMLFVRQDWLDQLGLAFPTTFEEVVEVAKAFQEAKLGGEGTLGLMVSKDSGEGRINGIYNAFDAYDKYWLEGEDGKLCFSNIQPNMREALLALQQLYADGVINNDFAVTTSDLASEYVAGGKCGIMYADSWAHTLSIVSLYNNDSNAKFNCAPCVPAAGHVGRYQADTASVGKIFVNAECEHPEAVMKLINLQYQLDYEDYNRYHDDVDGYMWYKLSWNGTFPCSVMSDMLCGYEVEQAWESGVRNSADYPFSEVRFEGVFNAYASAMNGEEGSTHWYTEVFGKDGAYTQLYYAIQEGLPQMNGYVGLPTETQQLMGDVINDKLNTAMLEVIMGADISVYDAACEEWLANGGQTITDEINAAAGR